MTSTLFVVQILLAISITIAVLLQKSSSIGLGAYSGSNESLFGAKGPTSFLAKTTFTLAGLLVLNTLVLGFLYSNESSRSVTDQLPKEQTQKQLIPNTPAAPISNEVPMAPSVPKTLEQTQKTSTQDIPAVPVSNEVPNIATPSSNAQ